MGYVATLPTSGPLLILRSAMRRWGSPRRQGLSSHLAQKWATSDFTALKLSGSPTRFCVAIFRFLRLARQGAVPFAKSHSPTTVSKPKPVYAETWILKSKGGPSSTCSTYCTRMAPLHIHETV